MCFRPAEIQMNTCPECGKANKPIAKECEACGAALNTGPASITCPICGTTNPGTATSCSNCGATEQEIMKALEAEGGTVGMPGAPKPPAAPGAPKPPMAPSAPKTPGAPPAL